MPNTNTAKLNTEGAIISVPMTLRFFVKPGFDAEAVQSIIDKHFGIGEAIVGSGYYADVAKSLLDTAMRDIEATDEALAAQIEPVISEIDLHRDDNQPLPDVLFL